MDDSLLFHLDKAVIEKEKEALKGLLETTSNQGVADYINVNISYQDEGKSIKWTQPKFYNQILDDSGLDKSSNIKDTQAVQKQILHEGDQQEFNTEWDYGSVIGKMNYLEKCTRPDIAYDVHQCARFQATPKYFHGEAVKQIGRYLLATRDKGLIYTQNGFSFECYCDADFRRKWNAATADEDTTTAKSRLGYIVWYVNYPVLCS